MSNPHHQINWYIFNVCEISIDVPFKILDISYFVFSVFFLVSLARSLLTVLIFIRSNFWFHYFSVLFSYILFYWFLILSFLFPFYWLILGFILSSFSGVLGWKLRSWIWEISSFLIYACRVVNILPDFVLVSSQFCK